MTDPSSRPEDRPVPPQELAADLLFYASKLKARPRTPWEDGVLKMFLLAAKALAVPPPEHREARWLRTLALEMEKGVASTVPEQLRTIADRLSSSPAAHAERPDLLNLAPIKARIAKIELFRMADLTEFFDEWAEGWAEFMPEMPTDMLALIAEVERLRAALSERAPEPPESWMTHHRSHGDVIGTERYYECKTCGATLWRAPEPQK